MKKKTAKKPARIVKVPTNLRLDPSIVKYYREGGDGWQTRLHEDLLQLVARRTRKAGR